MVATLNVVRKDTGLNIFAVSGSLRPTSSTTALMIAMARLVEPDADVAIYSGVADLPHFIPDVADAETPDSVHELRRQLDAADAVLICTPEYAHNLPGSLKNMLDWVVSSGELWRKPVATLSCSPNALGGAKAPASLRTTLLAMEANAPEDASLAVPLVRSKLAADGTITDPLLEQALNQVFAALVRVAAQPREL